MCIVTSRLTWPHFCLQTKQVRQSAAENLGQLTRMSMRVDQLAGDLLTNARQADPSVQEAYLTAVRGMLLTSGQRLSQPVLSRAGETLQSMMAAAGQTPFVLSCSSFFMSHCCRQIAAYEWTAAVRACAV